MRSASVRVRQRCQNALKAVSRSGVYGALGVLLITQSAKRPRTSNDHQHAGSSRRTARSAGRVVHDPDSDDSDFAPDMPVRKSGRDREENLAASVRNARRRLGSRIASMRSFVDEAHADARLVLAGSDRVRKERDKAQDGLRVARLAVQRMSRMEDEQAAKLAVSEKERKMPSMRVQRSRQS